MEEIALLQQPEQVMIIGLTSNNNMRDRHPRVAHRATLARLVESLLLAMEAQEKEVLQANLHLEAATLLAY